ncbi:MAG: hypothetical protein ACP5VS_18715 [Desulfomonilaceae bacterium]
MKRLFEFLLGIKSPTELRLTMAILAHAAGSPDPFCAVTYNQLQRLTPLSRTSLAKVVKAMMARGYIELHFASVNQPFQYRVLWHNLGISMGEAAPLRPGEQSSTSSQIVTSERLKSYFTNTGFLDMLPMAVDIASRMGYAEPEMIEAVCMVFDKQRVYPPTSNRLAWFATVYKEKLAEAHALIAHWRDKRERDQHYA